MIDLDTFFAIVDGLAETGLVRSMTPCDRWSGGYIQEMGIPTWPEAYGDCSLDNNETLQISVRWNEGHSCVHFYPSLTEPNDLTNAFVEITKIIAARGYWHRDKPNVTL